jgi:RNA polymerase sigma factor (sigma-70 family)
VPEDDLKDLVLKAQANDRAAYGELYIRYHQSIYRTVRRMLRLYPDAADDVTQDAFRVVLARIDCISDPSKFPGYLHKTAANLAVTFLRRMRAHPHDQLEETNPNHYRSRSENPEAGRTKLNGVTIHCTESLSELAQQDYVARRDTLVRILNLGLNSFNNRDRKALILKHFEEMTANEVAPIVGFPRPKRIYDLYNKYVKVCLRLKGKMLKDEKGPQPPDESP